jgi:hypothetical protein
MVGVGQTGPGATAARSDTARGAETTSSVMAARTFDTPFVPPLSLPDLHEHASAPKTPCHSRVLDAKDQQSVDRAPHSLIGRGSLRFRAFARTFRLETPRHHLKDQRSPPRAARAISIRSQHEPSPLVFGPRGGTARPDPRRLVSSRADLLDLSARAVPGPRADRGPHCIGGARLASFIFTFDGQVRAAFGLRCDL